MPISFEPLAAAYRETIQQSLPQITDEIARAIAEAFQNKTRHIVDYEQRTPWDASGELVDTKMPFILENYRTVADFWEEYAGYREPSYESGHGWDFPTFGNDMQRDLHAILAPFYQQALVRLRQEDPQYFQQLVAYIHQEYDDQARTIPDIFQEIAFHDLVGDTEIECEIAVLTHVQDLELAPLLQKYELPRCCQRTVLERIDNLSAFIDELAGYCTSIAHVTSATDESSIQLHMERSEDGRVVFGKDKGARELLMDHIAHTSSLILRCDTDATDEAGRTIQELRGWFIIADATSITPQRILPDDLYEATNTDAE